MTKGRIFELLADVADYDEVCLEVDVERIGKILADSDGSDRVFLEIKDAEAGFSQGSRAVIIAGGECPTSAGGAFYFSP
jgi:hypothetical protein